MTIGVDIEEINKPYKIVYVKYLDSFVPTAKILLEKNKYKTMIDKIETGVEDISMEDYNMYELEKGFELNCYIFVGKINDTIRAILNKIEESRIIEEDDLQY